MKQQKVTKRRKKRKTTDDKVNFSFIPMNVFNYIKKNGTTSTQVILSCIDDIQIEFKFDKNQKNKIFSFEELTLTREETKQLMMYSCCNMLLQEMNSVHNFKTLLYAYNYKDVDKILNRTIGLYLNIKSEEENNGDFKFGRQSLTGQTRLMRKIIKFLQSKKKKSKEHVSCVNSFAFMLHDFWNAEKDWNIPKQIIDSIQKYHLLNSNRNEMPIGIFYQHLIKLLENPLYDINSVKMQRKTKALLTLSKIIVRIEKIRDLTSHIKHKRIIKKSNDIGKRIVSLVRVRKNKFHLFENHCPKKIVGFVKPLYIRKTSGKLFEDKLIIIFNRWSFRKYRFYINKIQIKKLMEDFSSLLKNNYSVFPNNECKNDITFNIDEVKNARNKLRGRLLNSMVFLQRRNPSCRTVTFIFNKKTKPKNYKLEYYQFRYEE